LVPSAISTIIKLERFSIPRKKKKQVKYSLFLWVDFDIGEYIGRHLCIFLFLGVLNYSPAGRRREKVLTHRGKKYYYLSEKYSNILSRERLSIFSYLLKTYLKQISVI
jgi:hypothetical protein